MLWYKMARIGGSFNEKLAFFDLRKSIDLENFMTGRSIILHKNFGKSNGQQKVITQVLFLDQDLDEFLVGILTIRLINSRHLLQQNINL
jgi:hypothetical protein